MRGLLLCCLVALATSETIHYEPSLNPRKTYEYKYEGEVNFGRGLANLAESGVKLTCKIKIVGVSANIFVLQVSAVNFAEFNGVPGKNSFINSPRLAQRLSAQLVKPIMFEYSAGHVGNIQAPAEVSDMVVNIARGILSFFHVTVKTTQKIYQLEEAGIHGLCHSIYATEENPTTKDMTITQVVDINKCREKAATYRGMATTVADKLSSERGESVISNVRYVYTVKPTAEGGLITKAHALEQQHFTPFNVKGGSFKMHAVKEMELLGESVTAEAVTLGAMQSRGDLVFKFVTSNVNIPGMIQNLEDPVTKAVTLIKHLAQANIYQIDSATSQDTIKVYQLLRVIPYEGLEAMWTQFHANEEYRRWFLDMIVEVGDDRVLRFLENRFQAQDLTLTEAWQTLLMSFNHLDARPELVEMAKAFFIIPFSRSHEQLWKTVSLAYGSLVNKHCVYYTPCEVSAVEPLLKMATEALRVGDDVAMILALKALGNAGHPGSIKTIMRFIPGVAATPVELHPRVLSAAMQAMRLIGSRDPHSVQEITMTVFLQKALPAETRMMAFTVLFETKPSMALVSTLTSHLLEETDHQVVSFAYSYMGSLAKSITPDNHYLSTACNVALKILSPKFGRLSFHYSKALHMDWFHNDLLTGTASDIFMLRGATNILPTDIMMKGKLHFIGRILQVLEFGIRAEGIKELFGTHIPGFKGDLSLSDFKAIFNVLQKWELLPEDKPVLSAYSRASGQEWLYADIDKDLLRYIIKAFSPSAGKGSPLWELMENLQKGISFHKTKPFLIFETRFFQASTLGFPLEISKYYESVNGITVNAKAAATPPMTQHLGQLLNSEIAMETDGYVGYSKDILIFYGINTEMFQSGAELKVKWPSVIPWKLSGKINLREKKLELDIPPLKKPVELFSFTSDVYAVSRNIEDLASAKITPMMPVAMDTNDEIVRAAPDVVQAQSPQVESANVWHPKTKMCGESSIFGVSVCVESEAKRAFYHEEYPLYYLMGYTHMAVHLVPVHANKPVDRIHIELDAGSGKLPVNTPQLLNTVRRLSQEAFRQLALSSETASNVTAQGWTTPPDPVVILRALAVSGNLKPEGYDAAVYYTPEVNIENAQVIVSEIGEETNWKMCSDALMNTVHMEGKAHIRWGAECQSYQLTMGAATAHLPGSKPTLKTTFQWSTIPEYLEALGKSIEKYIPGVAFLLGFSQQNSANAKQEVSASFVVASADSLDLKIKFPAYTVYRQAIPFPLPAPSSQGIQQEPTNTTTAAVGHA